MRGAGGRGRGGCPCAGLRQRLRLSTAEQAVQLDLGAGGCLHLPGGAQQEVGHRGVIIPRLESRAEVPGQQGVPGITAQNALRPGAGGDGVGLLPHHGQQQHGILAVVLLAKQALRVGGGICPAQEVAHIHRQPQAGGGPYAVGQRAGIGQRGRLQHGRPVADGGGGRLGQGGRRKQDNHHQQA